MPFSRTNRVMKAFKRSATPEALFLAELPSTLLSLIEVLVSPLPLLYPGILEGAAFTKALASPRSWV